MYTRNTGLIKADWTASAILFFLEPATQVVGRPRLTSSAWLGPERTAGSHWGISSWMISVMVFKVSSSIPLATSTMIWPWGQNSFIRRAVDRTNTDGTERTSISFSFMASSRSAV